MPRYDLVSRREQLIRCGGALALLLCGAAGCDMFASQPTDEPPMEKQVMPDLSSPPDLASKPDLATVPKPDLALAPDLLDPGALLDGGTETDGGGMEEGDGGSSGGGDGGGMCLAADAPCQKDADCCSGTCAQGEFRVCLP